MKKLISFLLPLLLFASVNKFIVNNSYVVDPYNNYRVTSESQGYGLLYAYLSNNEQLFDSMWKWTKQHMQRKDYLFAWLYNKKILDPNNATDGDLFIAYALSKAADKWNKPEYRNEANKILNSVKELILDINDNYVILPAKFGFVKNDGIYVFPSYYVSFIFDYFSKKDNFWEKLECFNYFLFKNELSDKMFFSFFKKDFQTQNIVSMDVYRVILYNFLNNDNLNDLKKSFSKINSFFEKNGYIPLRFDLNAKKQGKESSPYCVYGWFYLLYGNKNYLNKYAELKKKDTNNYFCSFLDYFLQRGIK